MKCPILSRISIGSCLHIRLTIWSARKKVLSSGLMCIPYLFELAHSTGYTCSVFICFNTVFFCHIIPPSLLSESWLPPFPSCTMLLPSVESLDLPTKTNNKYITVRTSGFWGSQLCSPNTGDTYRCFSLYIFSTCSLNKSWHIPPCMAM